MGQKHVRYEPPGTEVAPLGADWRPPDYMGFHPGDPATPGFGPSIVIFTDTMGRGPGPGYDQRELNPGQRFIVRACPPAPDRPGRYLVALRSGGYSIARLVPAVGGGFSVRYDNPAYKGFEVAPDRTADVRALAFIVSPLGWHHVQKAKADLRGR